MEASEKNGTIIPICGWMDGKTEESRRNATIMPTSEWGEMLPVCPQLDEWEGKWKHQEICCHNAQMGLNGRENGASRGNAAIMPICGLMKGKMWATIFFHVLKCNEVMEIHLAIHISTVYQSLVLIRFWSEYAVNFVPFVNPLLHTFWLNNNCPHVHILIWKCLIQKLQGQSQFACSECHCFHLQFHVNWQADSLLWEIIWAENRVASALLKNKFGWTMKRRNINCKQTVTIQQQVLWSSSVCYSPRKLFVGSRRNGLSCGESWSRHDPPETMASVALTRR
jgi:hypothetical protein